MLLNLSFQIDAANAAHVSALDVFLKAVGGVQTLEVPQAEQSEVSKRSGIEKHARYHRAVEERKTVVAEAAEPKNEAPTQPETEPKNEVKYTLVQVQDATSEKSILHRDAIKAKLTELGAAKVSLLDPTKYGEFMDFLKSL